MYGDPKSLNIVASICSSCEIRQVELNLVPALVQPHRHGTDERLDSGGRLVVGGPKSSPNVLIVQHLHLKCEIFFELNGKKLTFLMIMTRKGSLIPRVSF